MLWVVEGMLSSMRFEANYKQILPSKNPRKIKHKMLCQFPNLPYKDFIGQQEFVMSLRDMDFSSRHLEMCF